MSPFRKSYYARLIKDLNYIEHSLNNFKDIFEYLLEKRDSNTMYCLTEVFENIQFEPPSEELDLQKILFMFQLTLKLIGFGTEF